MWLGITWDHSFHDLVEYVDLHLKDKFLVVPGVGDVQLGGWSNRTMRVWVDNEKLKKYDLTILDVRDTLKADYEEVASGYLETQRQEINVRTMGEERSAEDIANLVISHRGGAEIVSSPIRIRDVATVDDGLADIRRFSRTDGQPSLGLGIRKQLGCNDVETSDNVRKLVDELNKTLPAGMKLGVNYDSSRFTKDAIHETEFTLIMSVLITSLVCWAFLGSWRSTVNVLISIPTSILGAFIILHFCGYTLNFFTLLGLSLAVGIVVDDAIMVLENIVRHFAMGKDKVQASLDGAREITFAATAATVSVVAIFAPIFFVGGMIGVFLFQFGVTISAAVLISLLEAITLTPMRCSQFMQKTEEENPISRWVGRQFDRFAGTYRWVLELCLRHRWKVLGCSTGLFALSLLLVPLLRKEMIPPQDTGVIMLRFTGEPDASLERTSELIKPIEDYIQSLPYVKKIFVNVGGYGGGEVATGNIFITLVDRNQRALSQQEIVAKLREKFEDIQAPANTKPSQWAKKIAKLKSTPDSVSNDTASQSPPGPDAPGTTGRKGHRKRKPGLNIQIIDLSMGSFSSKRGTTIELSIRGPEYSVLHTESDEIMKRMEASGEFTDLDVDYREGSQQLRISPDRDKAAESNVSVQTIADTLNAGIGGIRVGQFTNGDRRYDMRIRLQTGQWSSPEDVQKLMVRTAYGELIPLSNVVHTEEIPTLQQVSRENRLRVITLFANNKPEVSPDIALKHALAICHDVLPEDYQVILTGSSKTEKENSNQLYFVLIMGLVIAYMVLATQFNSFVHPITVLTAIPFTFTGAFLSLYLTQKSLNLYSAIGIVLLMGITKKNSILLVEFFNKLRYGQGKSIREAILEGGPVRLRPIFMTSLATIAAAIPAAIGLGPGSEVRSPLAIVVIGGVAISTAFTLLVVPCFYSLITAIESKRGREQSARAYAELESTPT
jgi:HAE1 family hydrophobic/amphiphilic exporter-1